MGKKYCVVNGTRKDMGIMDKGEPLATGRKLQGKSQLCLGGLREMTLMFNQKFSYL